MKKIIFVFLIVTAVFGLSKGTFSQPKVILNLTSGYGIPLGDFKEDVPATGIIDGDQFPYYTDHYWNIEANGKLAFGRQGNWRAVLGFGYNMFSADKEALFIGDTAGNVSKNIFEPEVNIFSIIIGGEYSFLPKGKVNPFIGIGIPVNFISGEFDFGQGAVYINGDWRTGPMEMKSETRVGLTFDAGVDFTVNKQFGIITGLNYNLINLTGKKFFDQTTSVSNEVVLEDGNKTLSSINLYLGVSLYLGAR